MPTCPSGHTSADYDFCEVCGITIGGDAIFVVCPRCGVPRAGQFCEACGHDFTSGHPDPLSAAQTDPTRVDHTRVEPALDIWAAVVTADPGYYESVQAAGGPDADAVSFPVYCPQRRFKLSGTEVRVGRRSAHSGIDPEIDLAGPPVDPGVSRLHAVLIRAADGSWSVVDPGSANGTLVNGTEIARDTLVPLRDGDRINLGAWTELRIIRES
jgi:FHA domain